MIAPPKEKNYNPRIIGALLLAFSFAILALGGKNLYTIGSTYYLYGQTTQGIVKDITRNKWPQFRTFNYKLEYRDQQNNIMTGNTTVADVVEIGSEVPLIYSTRNPQKVYLNNAFIAAAGTSLGTLALGFFIAIFGLHQIRQRAPFTEGPDTSNKNAPPAKANLPSPLLKICQNILILAFLICVLGYLIGNSTI